MKCTLMLLVLSFAVSSSMHRSGHALRQTFICPTRRSSVVSRPIRRDRYPSRISFENTMRELAAYYWVDDHGEEVYRGEIAPGHTQRINTFVGGHFNIRRVRDSKLVMEHTVGAIPIALPDGVVCDPANNKDVGRRVVNFGLTDIPFPGAPDTSVNKHQTVLALINTTPCDITISWVVPSNGLERFEGDLLALHGEIPHLENTEEGHKFVIRLAQDERLVQRIKVSSIVQIAPCPDRPQEEAQASSRRHAQLSQIFEQIASIDGDCEHIAMSELKATFRRGCWLLKAPQIARLWTKGDGKIDLQEFSAGVISYASEKAEREFTERDFTIGLLLRQMQQAIEMTLKQTVTEAPKCQVVSTKQTSTPPEGQLVEERPGERVIYLQDDDNYTPYSLEHLEMAIMAGKLNGLVSNETCFERGRPCTFVYHQ